MILIIKVQLKIMCVRKCVNIVIILYIDGEKNVSNILFTGPEIK